MYKTADILEHLTQGDIFESLPVWPILKGTGSGTASSMLRAYGHYGFVLFQGHPRFCLSQKAGGDCISS